MKTLHFMLDEQRQLIESLKAYLHRLLKWQFGPKSEHLNVDQLGLFVDGSIVIKVPASAPANHAERGNTSPVTRERRRAVRILRNLPRVIEAIDVPEAQEGCPCCGETLTAFGHEASEQLNYILDYAGTKGKTRIYGRVPWLCPESCCAFICAAHQARISSRRRDGDNRVALIRHLQVLSLRRTLVDQAETGNTRISGRIHPVSRVRPTRRLLMSVTASLTRQRDDALRGTVPQQTLQGLRNVPPADAGDLHEQIGVVLVTLNHAVIRDAGA